MNSHGTTARLERSCGPAPDDWIKVAPPQPGLERIEARFAGHGFDPHRHDCYAIGITLEGDQTFDYRGTTEHSLAGQAYVLHPDEKHDGRAGTPEGFRYRSLYIEPRLIQDALGAGVRGLPFLADPLSGDAKLLAALRQALKDLDTPLEPLQRDQALCDIADGLAAADSSLPRRRLGTRHSKAVARAREFLDAHLEAPVASRDLEAASGLSRYALARHFRACLGTSPHRYHNMRRLERARALLAAGLPMAEAAAACGYADQSHMSRKFKQTYGLSPGRWRAMTRQRQS